MIPGTEQSGVPQTLLSQTLLIAAVAVVVSGAALAKDLKGTVMTDSEMDKVTAGATPELSGHGLFTACEAQGGSCTIIPFPTPPGYGQSTAASAPHPH